MVRALTLIALVGCAGQGTDTQTETTPVPDPYFTDTFPQTLITPIDVVWVVDPGWDEALQALDDVLMDEAFHLYLMADPSWRLGLLDASETGTKFGMLQAILETWPRTNPINSIHGDARIAPRYREALYTAFNLRVAEGDNEDFLRSDANLYVVYMGARPDASSDENITLDAFESWFADLRPSDTKRLSILTDPAGAPYWEPQVYGDGALFVAGSFRDQILEVFLHSMGQRVTFELTRQAVEAPLVATVTYREQRVDYAIDRDFTYDAVTNSITFLGFIPPPDSSVEVRYIPEGGVTTSTATDPSTTSTAL